MTDRDIIKILDDLEIEVAVSSVSSNYTCCVFIETTPPGSGPPPHRHVKEEELFTVLEGEYEFYDAGNWIPMVIGSPVLSTRNTYHAFRNVGGTPGRIMLVTNGGGIDDYFRAIQGLQVPRDIERLNEISGHYGYFYLPPS